MGKDLGDIVISPKTYQLRQKTNLAREMGICVIACWSRIGNKHTNALMSLMTHTQMMMITTLWTIPTTFQAISQISLLPQCTITLATPIPRKRSNQCRIAGNKVISHKDHKYSIIKHIITINSI
jgi:hypothetical protein